MKKLEKPINNINCKRNIFILIIAIIQVLIYSSCIDESSLFNDDKPTQTEIPIRLVYSDPDSLMFVSYRIEDSINKKIYSDIYFTFDSIDNKYKANIEYYHTDLSLLRAIFRTNAISVSINDVKQISSISRNNYNQEITYRLYTITGNYKDFTFQLTNNCDLDIPLLVINTENSKPIINKTDWIQGKMIIDKQVLNELDFDGDIKIKGRGNATWNAPKKPYVITLQDESELLGMNKHKKWVLISNPRDRTLLRNKVALEIAKKTGLSWVPNSKFVNVILNNKFIGCYLLTEKIEISPFRVNIKQLTNNNISGGYLMEIDSYAVDANVPQFKSQFAHLPFRINEQDCPNNIQMNYIINYINNIESKLYGNYIIDTSYRNYIDINSFIDYWIVNELVCNAELYHIHSIYMYKDQNEKLFAGPVWDFDMFTFHIVQGLHIMKNLWYNKLFLDPYFKAIAKQRWQYYKPSLETISSYIEEQETYISNSANMNWNLWIIDNYGNPDSLLPWEEAVDKMKRNYTNRLNWMDAQISTW